MTTEILIPNYNGHEALELCLASIFLRTAYEDPFTVRVYDNPGDGLDRPWLRKLRDLGRIELMEADGWNRHHGEAIDELLKACRSRYAVLIESDIEVLLPDWMTVMRRIMGARQNVIAVSRLFPAQPHWGKWMAPTYGPECMMLDMDLYGPIREDGDWQQRTRSATQYAHMDIFEGMRPDPNYDGTVNLDTGWRFYEKMTFDNRWGYFVDPLPADYFSRYVWHYGGISTRGSLPEIKPRWEAIRANLERMRRYSLRNPLE